MGQDVIKCNHTIMKKMKDYYKEGMINRNIPSSFFVAKSNGCTITAYNSGKVLFQGSTSEEEANKWRGGSDTNKKSQKKKANHKTTVLDHEYLPPSNIQDLSIIGSDEVGTGDYFGPITVAAVYTRPSDYKYLTSLGVKDSKQLTDSLIQQIAKEVLPYITYSLLILTNEKYNLLQKQGYSQGKMKAVLHNQAIQNVMTKLDGQSFDGILVDQFAKPNIYFNYLKDEDRVVKETIYFQTKAESVHLSVAVASIIARHAFLKEMDRLSEDIGVTLPKGAGAHVDQAAASIIKINGLKSLNHIAKLHFANTKKAQNLL